MSFFSENLNFTLNQQQLDAINHINGPGLVLAVPGSGKTTLLICRTIHLIEQGVLPNKILSLTFSKAAALDMTERYKGLFPNAQHQIGFSTIHRFCYSVLLQYFKKINRTYILLESKESPISKQKLLRQLHFELHRTMPTEDELEDLISSIGYVKNMQIDPMERETRIDLFPQIYKAYEAYKKENLLMDFDDMLTMCYALLKAKPQVLDYYQNKFDYIQVDESQDTSKVQHEIIRLLAAKHQNIYMVADDDQSIYGFRGAYPDAIVHIEDIYPKVKKYYLTTNYRSSKDIISLCSDIIDQNKTRYKKAFTHHHTHDARLEMLYVDTLKDQCEAIVDFAKSNDTSKAVLFRNNLSLIPLVDHLEREDVDFVVKDPQSHFFNHWCTLDIISFIKLALAPNDLDVFKRIYYKMNAYISKQQVETVLYKNLGQSVFDSLKDLPNLETFKQKSFQKIGNNFDALTKQSPEFAIDFIEDELNYRQYLTEHCKKNNIAIESPNRHIDIIKTIARHTDSLTDFLLRLDTLKSILYRASRNTNPYALKLLSIHASKGLEFDQIVLVDVDDKVFPSKHAVDNFDDTPSYFEEERRLFYVALSRAKSSITIIHTKFKNGQYNKASEFVKDYIDCAGDMLKTTTKKIQQKSAHGFQVGDRLLHTSFGTGYLIEINDDRMMIEFKDSTKTLSAALCLDQKIIIKIE